MNKKQKLTIPNSFVEFVADYDWKRRIVTELTRSDEARERQKQDSFRRRCEARANKDLGNAKYICDWVEEFRASSMGRRILDSLPKSYRPDRGLTFFEWHPDWGYSISTTDNGIEWYRWGPGSQTVLCKTPDELAYAANVETPGMLKAASKAIQTKEVWTWIKKDLDLFKNKRY